MTSVDEQIFVALQDSLVVLVYTASGDHIASVDCTESIIAAIQSKPVLR